MLGEAEYRRSSLWGTRDGGQTWNRFAQDDDNRSPLVVTVDDEGMYGFQILVQNAGGASRSRRIRVTPRSFGFRWI